MNKYYLYKKLTAPGRPGSRHHRGMQTQLPQSAHASEGIRLPETRLQTYVSTSRYAVVETGGGDTPHTLQHRHTAQQATDTARQQGTADARMPAPDDTRDVSTYCSQ